MRYDLAHVVPGTVVLVAEGRIVFDRHLLKNLSEPHALAIAGVRLLNREVQFAS